MWKNTCPFPPRPFLVWDLKLCVARASIPLNLGLDKVLKMTSSWVKELHQVTCPSEALILVVLWITSSWREEGPGG